MMQINDLKKCEATMDMKFAKYGVLSFVMKDKKTELTTSLK